MISTHLTRFAGKPVFDFEAGSTFENPAGHIPRLRVEFESEGSAVDLFRELLESDDSEQLTGVVFGVWSGEVFEDTPAEIVEALVAAAGRLPQLRALFIGDMISEENEISWIHQCDLSALWDAFPRLEVLGIRGTEGLSLGNMRLNHLRELTIQCGGLPKSVLAELAQAGLPDLERLELFLGTNGYGWDGTVEDLQPLLSGEKFPKLKHLGLCDSEIADEVAAAVVKSPLIKRIESLDLSLGTLGEEGAAHLLASDDVKRLKKLDLHYHYMSDATAKKVAALGPEVDVSNAQTESQYGRYVSVGE